MNTPTRPEDLKHGDHIDIYEADGFLLYEGVIVTNVYILGAEALPLDFNPAEQPVIVEFWQPRKRQFGDIGTKGSPDSEREFRVTGHGWEARP